MAPLRCQEKEEESLDIKKYFQIHHTFPYGLKINDNYKSAEEDSLPPTSPDRNFAGAETKVKVKETPRPSRSCRARCRRGAGGQERGGQVIVLIYHCHGPKLQRRIDSSSDSDSEAPTLSNTLSPTGNSI
eukprot:g61020.t1